MNLFELITPLALITMGVAAAGIWSVICRITVMRPGETRVQVVIQHFALATGLFSVLVWSPNWEFFREFGAHGWVIDMLSRREVGALVLVTSVLIFLLLSAYRWRWRAPDGTQRGRS
jgi:hypothetical protein